MKFLRFCSAVTMLLFVFSPCVRLTFNQSKVFTYPLYGNITDLLSYYVNIYVGTPPQQQSVIVDTGSSFVGFPCKQSCRGVCGKNHMNKLFDSNKSESFAEETCTNNTLKSCECRYNKCAYKQVIPYLRNI